MKPEEIQRLLEPSGPSPWPILMFNVMSKPGGPRCNMACEYCYYRHNSDLMPPGTAATISDKLLERFIQQYIQAQRNPTVFFTWQGGEPTLTGLDFFEKVIRLQEKHARQGVQVLNELQTNGLLLDDTWCAFLRKHDFQVGLGIDGPADVQDRFRRTKGGDRERYQERLKVRTVNGPPKTIEDRTRN